MITIVPRNREDSRDHIVPEVAGEALRHVGQAKETPTPATHGLPGQLISLL